MRVHFVATFLVCTAVFFASPVSAQPPEPIVVPFVAMDASFTAGNRILSYPSDWFSYESSSGYSFENLLGVWQKLNAGVALTAGEAAISFNFYDDGTLERYFNVSRQDRLIDIAHSLLKGGNEEVEIDAAFEGTIADVPAGVSSGRRSGAAESFIVVRSDFRAGPVMDGVWLVAWGYSSFDVEQHTRSILLAMVESVLAIENTHAYVGVLSEVRNPNSMLSFFTPLNWRYEVNESARLDNFSLRTGNSPSAQGFNTGFITNLRENDIQLTLQSYSEWLTLSLIRQGATDSSVPVRFATDLRAALMMQLQRSNSSAVATTPVELMYLDWPAAIYSFEGENLAGESIVVWIDDFDIFLEATYITGSEVRFQARHAFRQMIDLFVRSNLR